MTALLGSSKTARASRRAKSATTIAARAKSTQVAAVAAQSASQCRVQPALAFARTRARMMSIGYVNVCPTMPGQGSTKYGEGSVAK